MPRITLAPDGAYSCPTTGLLIHALDDAAAVGKDRFLADGRRLLRAVGRVLHPYGFSATVRVARSGPATSGSITAVSQPADPTARSIHVTLEQACCDLTRRQDCIALVARWEAYYDGRRETGPNRWLDANLDHDTLARSLVEDVLGMAASHHPPEFAHLALVQPVIWFPERRQTTSATVVAPAPRPVPPPASHATPPLPQQLSLI